MMETKNINKQKQWITAPPVKYTCEPETDYCVKENKNGIYIVIHTKNYTVEIEID